MREKWVWAVSTRVSQIWTSVKRLTRSGLIWFSETLRVPWYNFSQNWLALPRAHWHPSFDFFGGNKKYSYQSPFIFESKIFALKRRFQIWSLNSIWITFDRPFAYFCPPPPQKNAENWQKRASTVCCLSGFNRQVSTVLLAKGDQMISYLNFEVRFRILSSRRVL